jgi:pimeloyl-ACP methyl ester carboxylesterase
LTACTVLITHGIDDKVVPVEVARDLHARIPESGYQKLPRCGHYFVMENLLVALLKAHRKCPGLAE